MQSGWIADPYGSGKGKGKGKDTVGRVALLPLGPLHGTRTMVPLDEIGRAFHRGFNLGLTQGQTKGWETGMAKGLAKGMEKGMVEQRAKARRLEPAGGGGLWAAAAATGSGEPGGLTAGGGPGGEPPIPGMSWEHYAFGRTYDDELDDQMRHDEEQARAREKQARARDRDIHDEEAARLGGAGGGTAARRVVMARLHPAAERSWEEHIAEGGCQDLEEFGQHSGEPMIISVEEFGHAQAASMRALNVVPIRANPQPF